MILALVGLVALITGGVLSMTGSSALGGFVAGVAIGLGYVLGYSAGRNGR